MSRLEKQLLQDKLINETFNPLQGNLDIPGLEREMQSLGPLSLARQEKFIKQYNWILARSVHLIVGPFRQSECAVGDAFWPSSVAIYNSLIAIFLIISVAFNLNVCYSTEWIYGPCFISLDS